MLHGDYTEPYVIMGRNGTPKNTAMLKLIAKFENSGSVYDVKK